MKVGGGGYGSDGRAGRAARGVAARFCVVDIETALSDGAIAIAAAGERPNVARVALHEVVAASVLVVERTGDGAFAGWGMTAHGGDGSTEPEVLRSLERALRRAYEAGATLVTFNGAHDLSVMRRRAGRHWLFDHLDFPEWPFEGGGRHLDMMRADVAGRAGRWPSLVDACAGFGVNAVLRQAGTRSAIVSNALRKAEVDVVATAILLLYSLAFDEEAMDPLVLGWASLATWLVRERRASDHLAQFARHPFADVARELAAGTSAK